MDQEIPDYDMDSADEDWLNSQPRKLDVSFLKFETMMDRLEKGSGQTVRLISKAKFSCFFFTVFLAPKYFPGYHAERGKGSAQGRR